MSNPDTITLTRSNYLYSTPVTARATLTSIDAEDTYYTWSPLEDVRDINVQYLDCERAIAETVGRPSVIPWH